MSLVHYHTYALAKVQEVCSGRRAKTDKYDSLAYFQQHYSPSLGPSTPHVRLQAPIQENTSSFENPGNTFGTMVMMFSYRSRTEVHYFVARAKVNLRNNNDFLCHYPNSRINRRHVTNTCNPVYFRKPPRRTGTSHSKLTGPRAQIDMPVLGRYKRYSNSFHVTSATLVTGNSETYDSVASVTVHQCHTKYAIPYTL